MRSIGARFISFQRKRPLIGDVLNLSAAVKGQKFSQGSISRALSRLVDKGDYSQGDRPAILRHLVQLSQSANRTEAQANRVINEALGGNKPQE